MSAKFKACVYKWELYDVQDFILTPLFIWRLQVEAEALQQFKWVILFLILNRKKQECNYLNQ